MSAFNFNDIPAMAPPPGHTPNFDNPESLHPIVLGVGVASIVLMTTALAIRIYTKAVILKDMRAEEYFAILGTIGIITWDAMFIEVSVNGFSRHLWDVRLTEVPNLSYMSYLAEITNAPTMFAAKCSILLQFRRLFCPGQVRDSTFWSIHALLFLCAAYYTSAIFTFTFQCIPREKTWSPLLEGQCIDVAAAIVVQGAVNLFLDLGILITPLWAIWRLQLPMKRKIGISAVFGVGILTCAIAAIGVAFRIPLLTDPDLTWLISKVGIWTMVEYCGTILVGCMPSFPRFFLHIQGKDASADASASSSHPNSHPSSNTRPSTRGQSAAAADPTGYHASIQSSIHSHSRNKSSLHSIGLAVSTSEASFTDPSYIEMENGSLKKPYDDDHHHHQFHHEDTLRKDSLQDRRSEFSATTMVGEGESRSSGCDDGDWSPLSSPRS